MAFKKPSTKTILIIVVLAIAAYLIYRWYTNRNSENTADNSQSYGANLNSVAPDMSSATGPDSGLNYTAPTDEVTINLPDGSQSVSNPPEPPRVGTPVKRPPGPPRKHKKRAVTRPPAKRMVPG